MASSGILLGHALTFNDECTISRSQEANLIINALVLCEDDATRWRPRFHVMPRKGWLNDPCGPCYDSVNEVYHLGFQWNPHGSEWGNISWGAATSLDMLNWTVLDGPSIQPSKDHDAGGVFSGCAVSRRDGPLVAFYTSAQRLPIHYTLPYSVGSEIVSMAVSTNSGRTWKRQESTSVINHPPPGLDVTGWRDPFIASWHDVDDHIRKSKSYNDQIHKVDEPKENLYALLSGGLRGTTPTTFLYRLDPESLTDWTYMGPLICPGNNFNPSPKWTGDFGVNWEVSNFITLSDDSRQIKRNYLMCGVEGQKATSEEIEALGEFRATRSQMWLCGDLQNHTERVEMAYRYGGQLDYGTYYAGNSFWDPVVQRHVVYGWILEEDLTPELRHCQGWAGSMSIPRTFKLVILDSIVGALRSDIKDIGSIECIETGPGTFTAVTMCAVPDPRLEALREAKIVEYAPHSQVSWGGIGFVEPCRSWELKMSLAVLDDSEPVGFSIDHGNGQATGIYFEPAAERIVVDRTRSSSQRGIRRCAESAPHTLFTLKKPSKANGEHLERETLDFHVFFDSSVLEIFVNERTALTSRVYPSSGAAVGLRSLENGSVDCRIQPRIISCEMWTLKENAISFD